MIANLQEIITCLAFEPTLAGWLSSYAHSEEWEYAYVSLKKGLCQNTSEMQEEQCNALCNNVIGKQWLRYYATPGYAIQRIKKVHYNEYDREDFCYAVLSLVSILGLEVDFDNVSLLLQDIPCRFNEEQIKASGIKEGYARLALAILDSECDKYVQKNHWLSPYSALLQRGWVEENMSAWCRTVNDLFGVRLDFRTMNKTIANNGSNDYTEWDTTDERNKLRVELAGDFDHRIDQYMEERRQRLHQSLNT